MSLPRWRPLPALVGISPGDHLARRDVVSLVEAATAAGLEMLILREPHLDERAYVTLARRLSQSLGQGLILHGRHPKALALAADSGWGLHLPARTDLAAARSRIKGILGVSCHNPIEVAAAAAAGCDYVSYSPIFTPTSKPLDGRTPVGTDGLEQLCRSTRVPVFALGGIRPDRVQACRRAGAAAVGVLGGLFPRDADADEVAAATRAYLSG